MTKQEFKETFIKNLRFYLPTGFKESKILMRLVKKSDKRLFFTDEIRSVCTVTHLGFRWRVEVREDVYGFSELVLLAHYKTANVSWEYPGKNSNRIKGNKEKLNK